MMRSHAIASALILAVAAAAGVAIYRSTPDEAGNAVVVGSGGWGSGGSGGGSGSDAGWGSGSDAGWGSGSDAGWGSGSDAGWGSGSDSGIALDAGIAIDASVLVDAALDGSIGGSCPIESLAGEELGDGQYEYPGDEIGCGPGPIERAPSARGAALFAGKAPARVDNKVKDAAAIEKAKDNERKHAELLAKNRERITEVLETPSKMPAEGEKNPLGVTFERFKLAVEGNGSHERVALQFIDTPAGGGEPARTAKENQDRMAAELKAAMTAINERLKREGVEVLGEYQFVLIGSGTTYFSNNHDKELGGETKVFGQKTVGEGDARHNENGTRLDLDIDLHITCPSMVDYVADKPHVLNDKSTRYLGPDNAVFNLFRSSGTNGVLTKYFPEIQEVANRWKDKLGIKEVEIKLVTDLEIKEVGQPPGPILLIGGP